jgi:hypothetical protein
MVAECVEALGEYSQKSECSPMQRQNILDSRGVDRRLDAPPAD